jgi:tight adherence protein C
MTDNVTFITLFTFVLTTGLVFLLARGVWISLQNPLRRRLEPQLQGVALDLDNVWIDSLAAQLPQRASFKSEVADELRCAGYFKPTALNVFLALRNGAVIAVVVATGLLVLFVQPQRQDLVGRVVVFGLATAGLCWSLPRLLIRAAGNRRTQRISRALPFGLDMTVMCLSGGLTLRDSLLHVSQEIGTAHPDLATELTIVQRHADLVSMESAFRQFARLIDTPEVAAMVALIIQNEQLGTNIAHSIRQYADAIRLKWRQLADERASQISVYVLFPITLCLLPAVLLVIWGPAAVGLVQFIRGFETIIPQLPELPTMIDPVLNR